MTMEERSGWRDDLLSKRRRKWGGDLPATDVDEYVYSVGPVSNESFSLCEYDRLEVVAIADYKKAGHNTAMTCNPAGLPNDSNLRVQCKLANKATLPFWVAVYESHPWRFKVHAFNDLARDLWLSIGTWFDNGDLITELEYVTGLYLLRDRPVPKQIAPHLDTSRDDWLKAS